jgi:hypothetical protein
VLTHEEIVLEEFGFGGRVQGAGGVILSLLWGWAGSLLCTKQEKREGARPFPLDLPKLEGKEGCTIRTGEIHAGATPRFAHLASTLNEPTEDC